MAPCYFHGHLQNVSGFNAEDPEKDKPHYEVTLEITMTRICQSLVVIMTCTLLALSPAVLSQESKARNYDNQSEEYLAISAVGKAFSTKWKVEVDFGQAFEWSVKNKDLLRDAKGQVISFNSPVDALNFLNSQGWNLVTASADETYFYAVMSRKK